MQKSCHENRPERREGPMSKYDPENGESLILAFVSVLLIIFLAAIVAGEKIDVSVGS